MTKLLDCPFCGWAQPTGLFGQHDPECFVALYAVVPAVHNPKGEKAWNTRHEESAVYMLPKGFVPRPSSRHIDIEPNADPLRAKLKALVAEWRRRQKVNMLTRFDFVAEELERVIGGEG